MALKIHGRMKVKTLKGEFKEEFGLTLRVYDGRSFADDEATLASLREKYIKSDDFAPKRNMKIGNFEKNMIELFGIKVQVSGSNDSYLCDNDLTLAGALEEDKKKLDRKVKKNNKENNMNDKELDVEDSTDGLVGFKSSVENILVELENAEEDEDSLIVTFLYNEKKYEYNAELDEYQNAEYLTNLLNTWMESGEIEQAMDEDMETEYNISIANIKEINISIE